MKSQNIPKLDMSRLSTPITRSNQSISELSIKLASTSELNRFSSITTFEPLSESILNFK